MPEIRLEVFSAQFNFPELDAAARALGYVDGEAAVRTLWERHRAAFLADLRGLVAQAQTPAGDPPVDEEPFGEPLEQAELVALLRDVAAMIECGESFEGRLEYHPRLADERFAVDAAIRVGPGQGSMMLYPRPGS